jgi:hypothetical protein
MTKISSIQLNSNEAFAKFEAGLRRAIKISPDEMNARIEINNAHREAVRVENGQPKRGPKPSGTTT